MELPNGEKIKVHQRGTQAFRYRALSRKIPSATCSTGYFTPGPAYKTSNGLGLAERVVLNWRRPNFIQVSIRY